MADGYAVKELYKVTSLLYDAMRTKTSDEDSADEIVSVANATLPYDYDAASKLSDLKLTRQLASEITHHGALLYDHLAKEPELKVCSHPFNCQISRLHNCAFLFPTGDENSNSLQAA